MQHLIINLEAPLLSLGGVTLDSIGPTQLFPGLSMLTGLIANALGYRREEFQKTHLLQDNITYAARMDRPPWGDQPSVDFQTVRLNADDKSWTTYGRPEGRAGDKTKYNSPHLRWREYLSDAKYTVALHLNTAPGLPQLEEITNALTDPERPLFIGRKPFIPTGYIFNSIVEADTCLEALLQTPVLEPDPEKTHYRFFWSSQENQLAENLGIRSDTSYLVNDERDWSNSIHVGGRIVHEGNVPAISDQRS